MCACDCLISSKIMHYNLLAWNDSYLKKLKYHSHNAHTIMSGEMKSRILKAYNNDVTPHGIHIHKTASYMSMEKVCPFIPSKYALPQYKCLL